MIYYIIAAALLISSPAMAEFGYGGNSIDKPKAMMVSGNSVIDSDDVEAQETDNRTARQEIRDDANQISDPSKTTPPNPDIDPFQPAPQPQTRENVKKVLKKMPQGKIERSIADDRIDDGYVQKMIKNNLDFTGPIE